MLEVVIFTHKVLAVNNSPSFLNIFNEMLHSCRRNGQTCATLILTDLTKEQCFYDVRWQTECPSYTAVRRWSGLPCCCCPYLEQSVPTCHVHTLYVCFPRSPQGFPLQAFLPMTYRNFSSACTVTVVIFRHFNRSCLLLLYCGRESK